jgi:predicted ATPase/DNA-binding SARP family transcriptional activator
MEIVQIAVLGPLELTSGGAAIDVSGARLRRLVIRLAVDAPRAVSAGELADAVWGDQRPGDEANALQSLVSRLRRVLVDSAAVAQVPGGYRLTGVTTDLDRVTELVQQARTAAVRHDAAGAADLFGQALQLWRGSVLTDAADAEFAAPLVTYWDDVRMQLLAERIAADLTVGATPELVIELEGLARDFPFREEFCGQLMTALAAQGRPAEALAAYDRLRRRLADELGTDPSAELQQAYLALLRADRSEAAPDRARRRTNVRASLTSFLGRDDELKRVSALLDSGRLATIVGPGGAGKTRLAAVIATDWADRFSDGVWMVELAPVTDAANLPQAILGSLGIRSNRVLEQGVELHRMATSDRLLDVLSDACCLLVVDNCEHLITDVAELLDTVLARCPDVRVLTTSREPLGIDGEALCSLPPLTLPRPGSSVSEARSFASVQLFSDRAEAVSADFALTDDNCDAVVEIVRRLDGLPLAIELAAARLRVLPVDEVAARLTDRFRLLTGGSRVAMPRHRTLRAVVDWSWDLLTPTERLLAERLSVFPSGATPESAVAICSDDRLSAEDVPDLLGALVDKSLLQVSAEGGVRYRMLETIREYGIERLSERGEVSTVRLAHATFFAALVA